MPFNYRKQILICARQLPSTDPCCTSSSTPRSCMRSSTACSDPPSPPPPYPHWPTLRYQSSVPERVVPASPPQRSRPLSQRDPVLTRRRSPICQMAGCVRWHHVRASCGEEPGVARAFQAGMWPPGKLWLGLITNLDDKGSDRPIRPFDLTPARRIFTVWPCFQWRLSTWFPRDYCDFFFLHGTFILY